jgi:hypothetical protein
MHDPVAELLRSKAFLEWPSGSGSTTDTTTKPALTGRGKSYVFKGRKYTNLMADEKHYELSELAELWGVSAETIRNVFRNEPDVLRHSSKPNGKKRKYVLMRIPLSVAQRVHKRLAAMPG